MKIQVTSEHIERALEVAKERGLTAAETPLMFAIEDATGKKVSWPMQNGQAGCTPVAYFGFRDVMVISDFDDDRKWRKITYQASIGQSSLDDLAFYKPKSVELLDDSVETYYAPAVYNPFADQDQY